MSFLEDVAAEAAPTAQCKTCRHLADMPEPLRSEVIEALASDAAGSHIARALTKRGYPVSETALRAHRNEGHDVR